MTSELGCPASEHFGGRLVQKGPLRSVVLPGSVIALSEREPTGASRGSSVDHIGFDVDGLKTEGFDAY